MQLSTAARRFLGLMLSLAILALSSGANASPGHKHFSRSPSPHFGWQGFGIKNGPSFFRGRIHSNQHIYYVGDPLEISVKFPRGVNLLQDGEADVHIVIYSPNTSLITVPIEEVSATPRRFFSIPAVNTTQLPEGQYQLALVLTVPDGDPSNLDDWYNGFSSILDTKGIYISTHFLHEDADEDGEWDSDDDGDGFFDEEDEADDADEEDEVDDDDDDDDDDDEEEDDSGQDSPSDLDDSDEDL